MKNENLLKRSSREYLSREDIARRAEAMLFATLGDRVDLRKPAPLKRLLDVFTAQQWLSFSRDDDLGRLPGGQKIYGEFTVNPLRIFIDRSVAEWSSRFRFTLAHEIGHFVLHRRMIGPGRYIDRTQLPADSAAQMKYREMATLSDLGWAEWQANEFALALIMPLSAAINSVFNVQRELGIVRNLGIIYLDHQPQNRVDCGLILSRLRQEYQVPMVMLRRRLRYLGILKDWRPDRRKSQLRQLGSLFSADEEVEV